jgi:hypothetical protein
MTCACAPSYTALLCPEFGPAGAAVMGMCRLGCTAQRSMMRTHGGAAPIVYRPHVCLFNLFTASSPSVL